MSVTRLLYRSDSELSGSDRAVRESALAIAHASRTRNAAEGVSGALMFASGVFIQLLEGDSGPVETTFERICRDGRHRRLQLLDFSTTEERTFGTWDMVAFEGDAQARAIFPGVADGTVSQRNRISANAVIELMQVLLAKRTTRAPKPGVPWGLATNVMG